MVLFQASIRKLFSFYYCQTVIVLSFIWCLLQPNPSHRLFPKQHEGWFIFKPWAHNPFLPSNAASLHRSRELSTRLCDKQRGCSVGLKENQELRFLCRLLCILCASICASIPAFGQFPVCPCADGCAWGICTSSYYSHFRIERFWGDLWVPLHLVSLAGPRWNHLFASPVLGMKIEVLISHTYIL